MAPGWRAQAGFWTLLAWLRPSVARPCHNKRGDHWPSVGIERSSLLGVRAGAEVVTFPSACFYAKQKL
jgi:hypothetical protein